MRPPHPVIIYTLSHIFICKITDLAGYVPVLLKMKLPHHPAFFNTEFFIKFYLKKKIIIIPVENWSNYL